MTCMLCWATPQLRVVCGTYTSISPMILWWWLSFTFIWIKQYFLAPPTSVGSSTGGVEPTRPALACIMGGSPEHLLHFPSPQLSFHAWFNELAQVLNLTPFWREKVYVDTLHGKCHCCLIHEDGSIFYWCPWHALLCSLWTSMLWSVF